jgi:hypothetical protein
LIPLLDLRLTNRRITRIMIEMRAAWMSVLAACSFSKTIPLSEDGPTSDASSIDASIALDVAHLGPAEEAGLVSTLEWTIDTATTIRTSGGTPIQPAPPAGIVVLAAVPQESGGSVMVIQAKTIVINAPVTVEGSLPLIVVATETLALSEAIDGAADRNTPGPGGTTGGMGVGGNGQSGSGESDCGGGGGGFQSAGAPGGDCKDALGAAGGAAFVPAVLLGGSGGGNASPSSCNRRGGAGGGALQFSAGRTITLSGAAAIDVGGGGGDRGVDCDFLIGWDGAAGAGGGSGGMIYLQAPSLLGTGILRANGGGAGGAANSFSSDGSDGGNGRSSAGAGGAGSGGGNGGHGAAGDATGDSAAARGESKTGTDENSGGGGGGIGWIFVRTTTAAVPYASSPPVTAD